MDSASADHCYGRKDKVVVIIGATSSGKSRLSIELATLCACSEIINSDKMQVYKGLDITTNKIPVGNRKGVPHHLLGDVDPADGEFSPSDFRFAAGTIISKISSRGKLPIVVGGSNSFIHALLADQFDPELNVFDDESSTSSSLIPPELRYKCCLLWVDVWFPVLSDYIPKLVDNVIEKGMVDELAEFFEANGPEDDSVRRIGLRKAIGVPEFDPYFKMYPSLPDRRAGQSQIRRSGWHLQKLDATEACRVAMTTSGCSDSGERWSDIWKREVVEPSVKIVKRFLNQ